MASVSQAAARYLVDGAKQAFTRLKLEEYRLDFYTGKKESEARCIIARKLLRNQLMVNVSPVNKERIEKALSNSNSQHTLPDNIYGAAINAGLVWANCFVEDTGTRTGKIYTGKPVTLDTVTGRFVTGIHPSWSHEEYVTIGIAFKTFEGPNSPSQNKTNSPYDRVPILLLSKYAPKPISIRWMVALNTSGEEIPPCSVVQIGGSTVKEKRLIPGAGKPYANNHYSRLHGVSENLAIPKGELVRFTVDRNVPCNYDDGDGTPSMGEGWGPEPDNWKLRKNFPGFLITGPHNNAGKAIVTWEPPVNLIGNTFGPLLAGSTANIELKFGSNGTTTVNMKLNARDWLMKGGEIIEIGRKVILEWINGIWYVSEAACPPETT